MRILGVLSFLLNDLDCRMKLMMKDKGFKSVNDNMKCEY